jgi:SAM-dependent methyltransferase
VLARVARKSLRRFLDANSRWSLRLSAAAERHFGRSNGYHEFHNRVVPELLTPGLRVLDVGGGKFPAISAATRQRLGLRVDGLDISRDELERAPTGSYDQLIVGDAAEVEIAGPYDLIISVAVLEHVRDSRTALTNLAGALAEGGRMAHFIPCVNTLFASVNRLLGNGVARRLLHGLDPEARRLAGFKCYYRHCSPAAVRRICAVSGLETERLKAYFFSEYTRFLLPVYCLELLRQLTLQWLGAKELCESFLIVARKPVTGQLAAARSTKPELAGTAR